MSESMSPLPQRTNAAASNAINAALGFLVGLLLFGDYLALTLSRALTGSPGNWIVFAGALQPVIVVLSLLLGQVRDRLPWALVIGFLGLCAIGLGHAIPVWLEGNELSEYSSQKLAALFFLLGPALACGIVVGCRPAVLGARSMPWLMAPLLLLCGIAIATNPRLMTIEYFADPPVFFGFLVMPAHQPLALCLTKAALLCFALDQPAHTTRSARMLRLGFVGAMLGLVLLTGARSYAIALVAALAAQAMLSGRRLGLFLVGTAIALLLFQSYASDLVQDRFDPTQVLESLAYREREQAWQAAWTAFLDNPLVGVGAGCFASSGGWHGRVYPHNLLLEIAAEFGLCGLCCLIAMLAGPVLYVATMLRQRTKPGSSGVFALGLLVFSFGGALAVGDLIRNYFLLFGLGMAATSLRAGRAAQATTTATLQPQPIAVGIRPATGGGG